jgi:hypothetical protein
VEIYCAHFTFVTHGLSGNSNNVLEACWAKKLKEGAESLGLSCIWQSQTEINTNEAYAK